MRCWTKRRTEAEIGGLRSEVGDRDFPCSRETESLNRKQIPSFTPTMKTKNVICLASLFFLLAFDRAQAQLSYTLTDLGTLGGTSSVANSVNGQGRNAAGMIVGSSTTSDGTEHAFLYVNDQMFDLNMLTDLTSTNFK